MFGLTDNHQFRHKQADIQRPTVGERVQVLDRRAQGRPGLSRLPASPIPSTSWPRRAAGSMRPTRRRSSSARMQDLCPNFAQHVFAMSSVSGGSLGAAVFAGLTRSQCRQQRCQAVPRQAGRPRATSRRAPTPSCHAICSRRWCGAALFPDFLQRFIPWPLPAFDRARRPGVRLRGDLALRRGQGQQSAQRLAVRSVRSGRRRRA